MKTHRKEKRIFIVTIFFFVLTISSPLMFAFSPNDHASMNSYASYHYRTYQEMTDLLKSLAQNNSNIMSLTSIGTTYQGRDIWMVKLSDNVTQNEDEPGVLFMGAHHGNEKPSYEVCIFFIQYMVENYGNSSMNGIKEALDTTQIFVIPMVNPDGVEADTRKNCAPNHGPFGLRREITSYGVNLNRNYGDYWFLYYIFPLQYGLMYNMMDSSMNYRGPRPFSENETKAVKNFVDSHDISLSLSYHTYGEYIFYPWMHTTKPTRDEALFISVGENISNINHYYLFIGEQHLIPRYGGTLGTSENWLYREHGIIAYTIELGTQRAPTNPDTVENLCLTHVKVNLYICQRAQTIESDKRPLHS